MDAKKLQELEENLAAIQREIEALKAQPVEEEIPKGTIVKVWSGDKMSPKTRIYVGVGGPPDHFHETTDSVWRHATPHPNYMMWRKHDGGPQPVGDEVEVVVRYPNGVISSGVAKDRGWANAVAFAVLTTPEFT